MASSSLVSSDPSLVVSPDSPIPPPAAAPLHPLLTGLSPALLERLGWRVLAPGSAEVASLRPLGFTHDAEQQAQGGAVLAPLFWRVGDRMHLVNHRLRHDTLPPRSSRYELTRGSGQKPLCSAYGALLEDPTAWSSDAPVLLVEGERPAALLASLLPEAPIVACPGAWTAAEPSPFDAAAPTLAKQIEGDLGKLSLAGRVVLLLCDREVDGTPSPSVLLSALGERLEKRDVASLSIAPPLAAPACWIGWLEQLAAEPRVATETLRGWLEEAGRAPEPLPEPPPPEPGPPRSRIHDLIQERLRVGPAYLHLPEGYFVAGGASSPLCRANDGRGAKHIASSLFWPVAHLCDGDDNQLELALIVAQGPCPQLRTHVLSRALLHDAPALASDLARRGVNIRPGSEKEAARYLSAFLEDNHLPVYQTRAGTGWSEDRRSFQYGSACLGSDDRLARVEQDEATRCLVSALRVGGDPQAWTAAAEELIAAAPVASLALAASIASPMLSLFGWPPIGLLLGALGGAGKSTMLRAAASVFGATGPSGAHQPEGLVGKGTGTPKRLLLQFRGISDLPHLLDEVRPSVNDPRQRDELASVLHQIYDGREHSRATRDSSGSKIGKPFPGCLVVAGEVAASDFLRQGGVIRRLLSPPAPYVPAGAPLGRFHEVFATHFGHLGRALVEALVRTTPEQRQEMATRHAFYHGAMEIPADAPEHVRSWSRQIGTALAAVDVARQLCPALCPHATRWKQAIQEAWEPLREADVEPGGGDVLSGLEEKVRAWVARFRWHLLPTRALRQKLELRGELSDRERLLLTPKEPVLGQVVSVEHEGEEDEVLGQVDVFQSLLTKFLADEGYSAGSFTGALAERGLFAPASGASKHGLSRLVRIQGTVVRVYRVCLTTTSPSDDEAA